MGPVCYAKLPRWEDLLVTDLCNLVQSGIVKYMCYARNPEVRVLCKVQYVHNETLQWLYEKNPDVCV